MERQLMGEDWWEDTCIQTDPDYTCLICSAKGTTEVIGLDDPDPEIAKKLMICNSCGIFSKEE